MLETGRARRVIAAQTGAIERNPVGVHITARLQIINARPHGNLGVDACRQLLPAQRSALSGKIDKQQ